MLRIVGVRSTPIGARFTWHAYGRPALSPISSLACGCRHRAGDHCDGRPTMATATAGGTRVSRYKLGADVEVVEAGSVGIADGEEHAATGAALVVLEGPGAPGDGAGRAAVAPRPASVRELLIVM